MTLLMSCRTPPVSSCHERNVVSSGGTAVALAVIIISKVTTVPAHDVNEIRKLHSP